MADSDNGDKTEQPTQRRLDDQRKKGHVSKSREVTSTVVLAVFLVLLLALSGLAASRLAQLFDLLFSLLVERREGGFAAAAARLVGPSGELVLMLSAAILLPLAAVGLLVEFLQVGAVLSFERLAPSLEKLNPAEGLKRMFSLDNLIEVLASLFKTALLLAIGWLVFRSLLPATLAMAEDSVGVVHRFGDLTRHVTGLLVGATVAVFGLVAVIDALYRRWSYLKKLRMSRHDLKQEAKESEGDPMVKQQRRRAAQEWSHSSATQSARQASVLVVNPTHVAIAIVYDRDQTPVPMLSAKGEDDLALAMRRAAEESGVPILRNIPLARDLLARGEVGDVVPADLFEVIAELILWAREVRVELEQRRDPIGQAYAAADACASTKRRRSHPPGVDLSRYS